MSGKELRDLCKTAIDTKNQKTSHEKRYRKKFGMVGINMTIAPQPVALYEAYHYGPGMRIRII
jgi:hypothetical protein